MSEFLLPELEVDSYILDIKYDGPSFDGVMEIGALTGEIAGLELCIRMIIASLKKENKIDFDNADFQIVVEAFQNNCFRKKIRFKAINQHFKGYSATYAGAGSIGMLLVGIIALIPQFKAGEIKEMSAATMSQIADTTKIELLKDRGFLEGLAKTVKPLITDKDTVEFTQPVKSRNRSACVTYNQKNDFLNLTSEAEKLTEAIAAGDIYGRIVGMDVDANKNQIDFKADGEGERIYCSLKNPDDINAQTHLLGKWVILSGDIKTIEGHVSSVAIDSIKETPKKGQGELNLK